MKIPWLALFLPLLVTVAGCVASDTPNFNRMTEEEIFAYNLDQPLMKKIYCFEENETSTFIRRRRCMTVENYVYRLEKAVLTLDVMQPTGISRGPALRD